jgi:hypothetical protein
LKYGGGCCDEIAVILPLIHAGEEELTVKTQYYIVLVLIAITYPATKGSVCLERCLVMAVLYVHTGNWNERW